MAKHMAFRIKIAIVETELEPSSDRCLQEEADGSSRLVLPEADELNMSALDRAALDVSFPALREALSRHLTESGKKQSTAEPGPGATRAVQRLSGRRRNRALSLSAVRGGGRCRSSGQSRPCVFSGAPAPGVA